MSRRASVGGRDGKSVKQAVRVMARIRPSNQKEINLNMGECITSIEGPSISVYDGIQTYPFTLDAIFGANSTQVEVFKYAAEPLIDDVLTGYNATIFAYGQTSSGKTHTVC